MLSQLRQAAVLLLAGAVIFFCSCERHKASELPAEKSEAVSDAKHPAKDAKKAHADDGLRPAADDTASPAGTPANFFPSASPSPQ